MQVYYSADGGGYQLSIKNKQNRIYSTKKIAQTLLSDSRNNDFYRDFLVNQ